MEAHILPAWAPVRLGPPAVPVQPPVASAAPLPSPIARPFRGRTQARGEHPGPVGRSTGALLSVAALGGSLGPQPLGRMTVCGSTRAGPLYGI